MATTKGSRTKRAPGPSVFAFVDFRAYLRAYYEAEKASKSSFSYRAFARRAGLKSPNFLKLVIDGERNLGKESIERFADVLALDPAEREFFADLVAFGQATNVAEKNDAFTRVAASRRFRSARRIDGALFEYLSHWYNPAIRELAARADFVADARWIATQLRPRISVSEASSALELLIELGLLVRDEKGAVHRGEPTLTTEHEVRSLAIASFHRQMLERASAAIDEIPREQRDLSALTVCVSPRTAALVKARLHQLREELTELCDADGEGSVVYQLNVQWFPLSVGTEEIPT